MTTEWRKPNPTTGFWSFVAKVITQEESPGEGWVSGTLPEPKELPEGVEIITQYRYLWDEQKWGVWYDLYHRNLALHLKYRNGAISILLGYEGTTFNLPDDVIDFQFVPYPEQLDIDTRQHGENIILGLNKVLEVEAGLHIDNPSHNEFMLNIIRMKLAGGQEIKDEQRQALLTDDNFHHNTSVSITHEDAQKKIDAATSRWTTIHNSLGSNYGARTHRASTLLGGLKDKTGFNLVREFNNFYGKLDALLSNPHQSLLRSVNLFLQRQQDPLTLLTGEFRLTLAHVRDVLAINESLNQPSGASEENDSDFHPLPKHLRERS